MDIMLRKKDWLKTINNEPLECNLCGCFQECLAIVGLNGKYGLIDREGA